MYVVVIPFDIRKIVVAIPEVNRFLHNISYTKRVFISDLICVILEICNVY